MSTEELLLKWGTLKEWNGLTDASIEILEKWIALGVSTSCMAQDDTPEQKALLCDLIDQLDGTIQNDWTGDMMTKDEAKEYIMHYRAKVEAPI